MPIRRSLRPLYPENWKAISELVRFKRAKGLCQQCGRLHGRVILCLPDGSWLHPVDLTWRTARNRRRAAPDLLGMIGRKQTRVVLAAAHLRHDPGRNRRGDLRAFCQRCHLQHDRDQHRVQRWITCRSRSAIGDLFLGLYSDAERLAGRGLLLGVLVADGDRRAGDFLGQEAHDRA